MQCIAIVQLTYLLAYLLFLARKIKLMAASYGVSMGLPRLPEIFRFRLKFPLPVIVSSYLRFCEVANLPFRYSLVSQIAVLHAASTLVPLPAASQRVNSTATANQIGRPSIFFTSCVMWLSSSELLDNINLISAVSSDYLKD